MSSMSLWRVVAILSELLPPFHSLLGNHDGGRVVVNVVRLY
jgi:hypothetical protein